MLRKRSSFIVLSVVASLVGSFLLLNSNGVPNLPEIRGPLAENEDGGYAPLDGPPSSALGEGKPLVITNVARGNKRLIDLPNSQGVKTGLMREMLSPKPNATSGTTPSALIQTTPGSTKSLTTSTGFAGLNYSNNGSGWPPDTVGDIGPTDYVQAVNSSVGIFSLSNNTVVAQKTQNFNDFMKAAGQTSSTACGSQNQGDPVVLFDVPRQKWLVMDFAFNRSTLVPSYFCVAISSSSDAMKSTWNSVQILASSTALADYPKIASTPNGIMISANMFTNGKRYAGASVWMLNKEDLFGGSSSLRVIQWTAGTSIFSLMPVNVRFPSAGQLASQVSGYLLSDYGTPGYMQVYQLPSPLSWSSTNPAWKATRVPVASFTTYSGGIPQYGSSQTLDSLADRLMYAAQMSDSTNTSNAKVYVARTVKDNLGYAGVRWYEFQVTGTSPSVFSVLNYNTYSPSDSTYRWMPSLAVNGKGEVALGFSVSSPTNKLFPSIAVAGRSLLSIDKSQFDVAEGKIMVGTGTQTTYGRWGDYSMVSVSPANSCTFWVTHEYYANTGTNWQTYIAPFTLTSCP